MTLDKIQAWALMLEMIGIGLAALHIFGPRITRVATGTIESLETSIRKAGIAISLDSANEDISKPLEARDQIARENAHTLVTMIPAGAIAFYLIEFGDGFFWGVAEFIVIGLLALPLVLLLQAANIFFVRVIVRVTSLAGKGDIVAGVGLFLAAIGLCLETFQVWHGPYRWIAIVAWALVVFVAVALGVQRVVRIRS